MRNGKLVIVEVMADLTQRCGAETFFFDLAKEMSKRDNVELHVVVLYDEIDPSFEEFRHTDNLRFYTLGKKPGIDIKAALRFRRLIRRIRPDIVHGHRAHLMTYWLAFGRRKQPFKLVHTCHSVVEDYDRIKAFFNRKHRITFICISDLVADRVKETFKRSNTETIYNGVYLPKIQIDNKDKLYDFICVAAFRPVKNHPFLVDAFDRYYASHPQSRLLCLGAGPTLSEVVAYAKEKAAKEAIVFPGSSPHVYDYLKKSKVFVLASKYEGTPVSIVEAMNAGLPIVAPRVGGIPDLVKDGENGYLFSPGDVDAFANCMDAAIKTYPENIMGQANRSKAQRFNIQNCCDQHLQLFSRLVSGK